MINDTLTMNRLSNIILLFVLCAACVAAQTIDIRRPLLTAVYDLRLQSPRQVVWRLHRTDIGHARRDPSWLFVNDIPSPLAIASHTDFTNSGYDRGHLCPAQDRSYSTTAMQSTFVLSNVSPQLPAVNRGSWKHTENVTRQLAQRYGTVDVVTVPIFLHRDTVFIGRHRLAVPHAFFKAVWIPSSDSVIACWFIFNHQ